MRIESDLYKALSPYIIEAAMPLVLARLTRWRIRLDFSDRKGRILGFYRGKVTGWFKRPDARIDHLETISLRITLNPYALLLVFIHEWAHLLTHRAYPEAKPHGKEWKGFYKQEVQAFLRPDIFPPDMLAALTEYFKKPGAYWDERLAAACAPYGKDRKAFERIYKRLAKHGRLLPAPVTYRLAYGEKEKKRGHVEADVREGVREPAVKRPVLPPEPEACGKPAPPVSVQRAAAGTLQLPVCVRVQERWARLEKRKGDYLTGVWEDTGKTMRVHRQAEVGVPAAAAAVPSEAPSSAGA